MHLTALHISRFEQIDSFRLSLRSLSLAAIPITTALLPHHYYHVYQIAPPTLHNKEHYFRQCGYDDDHPLPPFPVKIPFTITIITIIIVVHI